jgi:hypothetical protein
MSAMNEIRNAPTTQHAKGAGRRLLLPPASSITPQAIDWTWTDYVPAGMFGLLAGREGLGKSLITIWVAAQLSRGTLPGVHHGTPKRTLILASEDSWAHVIVPRLTAAGADLDYVHNVKVLTADGDDELSLAIDLAALRDELTTRGDVALIVFDPIISRLSARLDTHKDAEVRRELHPLAKLATETNVTMLGLIHVNKSATTDPLNSVMGSRAFTAVSRFVLFVAEDPQDESVRLFGQPKTNLGPKVETQTFEVQTATCPVPKGRPIETGLIKWTGSDARSIREILQAAASLTGPSKKSKSAVWLRAFLLSQHGAADSAAVKSAGKSEGFSESTLLRAARLLQVTFEPHGFPAKTFWVLPGYSVNLTHVATVSP